MNCVFFDKNLREQITRQLKENFSDEKQEYLNSYLESKHFRNFFNKFLRACPIKEFKTENGKLYFLNSIESNWYKKLEESFAKMFNKYIRTKNFVDNIDIFVKKYEESYLSSNNARNMIKYFISLDEIEFNAFYNFFKVYLYFLHAIDLNEQNSIKEAIKVIHNYYCFEGRSILARLLVYKEYDYNKIYNTIFEDKMVESIVFKKDNLLKALGTFN